MEQRTSQQNKALHVLFQLLADTLNDAGLEMKKVLSEKEVDIPWNETTIKECLWKPLQKAMLHKTSTTELEKKEVDDVFNVLNRHLGEKFGINIEFPSEERGDNGRLDQTTSKTTR